MGQLILENIWVNLYLRIYGIYFSGMVTFVTLHTSEAQRAVAVECADAINTFSPVATSHSITVIAASITKQAFKICKITH